ncbi:MAG: hypothetical protein EOP45_14360 [Sphingobacteriaceae bacterium]|nr:MAG: hypothetical protein EOP45_14360 [Sphingobacteriaceae bacterium]
MADSLIQTIEQKLGIPAITKVDPNTQNVKGEDSGIDKHTLDQAALPAVLAGLYKYALTDSGAGTILSENSSNWVNTFFGDKTNDIVAHVAEYASTTTEEATRRMDTIANEAATTIKENVKDTASAEGVHQYLLKQRQEILLYLPAELHIGDMLGDNTLDDRTNKMEGPVSSFLHKLGNVFNSTDKTPESKTHF